jgi:hypothetical protein
MLTDKQPPRIDGRPVAWRNSDTAGAIRIARGFGLGLGWIGHVTRTAALRAAGRAE